MSRLSFQSLKEVYGRIKEDVSVTPILTSLEFDALLPRTTNTFFKAELFQQTGSFKYRGANNALACMSNYDLKKGVVTYSTGNHGSAVARAAQLHDVQCEVVVVQSPTFKTN